MKYATVECDVDGGEVCNCRLDGFPLRDCYEDACKDFAENSFFSNKAYKILEFVLDTTIYPADKHIKDLIFPNHFGDNKCKKRVMFTNTLKTIYPSSGPLFKPEIL